MDGDATVSVDRIFGGGRGGSVRYVDRVHVMCPRR